GGTFPAPLFLFLAGISFALVTEKLWKKNLPPAQIARATIRRGAEIFAFGLLFRLQEYLIAWGWRRSATCCAWISSTPSASR
ncbi:MAG: heparan-alpha-glucosaminide N-acetyltransferase domain-containing protein, partial [Candidatus Sulfotelmatobacter sp.]